MFSLNKTILALCMSLVAPGCLAQNVIDVSTFDANLVGWSTLWPGGWGWSSRDRDNSPTSGSMFLVQDTSESYMRVVHCINFAGPGTLQGSFDFDGDGPHTASIRLLAYAGTNCADMGLTTSPFIFATDLTAGWRHITTPAFVVDATARSILVQVLGLHAYIDNVSLQQIPDGTPVTLQSFRVD